VIRRFLCDLLLAIPAEIVEARDRTSLERYREMDRELREARAAQAQAQRDLAIQRLSADNLRVALVMLTEAATELLQLFDGAIVHPRTLASFARLREAMQPGVQAAAAADQRASDAEEAPQGASADQPVQP